MSSSLRSRSAPPSPLHPLTLALLLGLMPAASALAQAQTGAAEEASSKKVAPAAKPPAQPPAAQNPAEATQQLERVEVSGTPSDEAVRRASTAAKIVIGREEIERFGDSTVGEVLKRLPGVTTGGRPGRGGDIRMRGMGGGYTQILVNGERMPPGFSLDQLAPDQLERIEVMRSPTAEYGARAVAGTINVVLREALQKRTNDLRFALGSERGQLQPNVGWSRNDKLDDHGGAYTIALNAMRSERLDDANSSATTHDIASGQESTLATVGQSSDTRSALNLNGRLQWRLGEGDSLSIQPFLVASKGSNDNQFTQTLSPTPPVGAPPQPGSQFDNAKIHSDGNNTMLRVNTQWTTKTSEDGKLDLRGGLGVANTELKSFRQEYKGDAPVRNQSDTVDGSNKSWSLNGKYSYQLPNEHSLVGGLEGEGTDTEQTRISLQNGLPRPELAEFGDDLHASTRRVATYVQDEWSVGKQWSFYAGLRGESILTTSTAANYNVKNRATVWTPLLHGLWKFDEKSRDQIRASLTRSYKSPNVNDLIARPNINPQYPCLPDAPCGGNEVNYPDRVGNPELKPELAKGFDVAYENYLAKGGVLSANFFFRRIDDLIRNVTELETVSWAPVPRWVSRPRNIGTAQTYGLELEAKFRLDEFIADAWPINIRSNLSLFHSNVDGIQGPNNKLDQQPKGTANLGADYRLRSLPISLGASINYTPTNTVQQTVLQESTTSKKIVTDAFVLWVVNPNMQFRASASNLAPQDYGNSSLITTTDKIISGESVGRTFTQWTLRMELKV